MHLALDIGGTFTDLVAFDERTGELRHAKSSTTPADLTQGILICLGKADISLRDCKTFIHGATVAINTLIEKTGARTVLVTTEGARDAYLIGRGNRPEAYNVFFHRPEPLTRRSMIVEVRERLSASGEPMLELTDAEIAAVCARVAALQPEAIAVCLLHSYVNSHHEKILGEALRRKLPGAYLSVSHEILRQYREYERTSTTVVNAYIGPRVSGYLRNLEHRLADGGFGGTLLIMQSNGGVTSIDSATRVPVALMESGPVGGINASAEFGRRLNYPQVIAFDMGGTTAKASLIRDGVPATAEGYYVGGYASGHPVMLPVVDVVEVGAGGGSIGWIDEVGALRVGPLSAGAHPGPVCYADGGKNPTVTDANLVLGRINSENFLGGEMRLDVSAARNAIESSLARPLGLTVEEAALGMLKIAVANMTLAVRGVSIERGYDPRDFVMFASGGNGGLHGPLIARELAIPKVILPVLPAHFSAVGMMMTDLRHDFVQTYPYPLESANFREVADIFRTFDAEGRTVLNGEGTPESAIELRRSMDIRYIGQEYYLNVPVTEMEVLSADRPAIRERFGDTHERIYGQRGNQDAVEIVNLRVSAHGVRPKMHIPAIGSARSSMGGCSRDVILDDPRHPVRCAIYDRATLSPRARIEGPAIIEEDATTVLLLPSDSAVVHPTGEIVIEIWS